MKQPLFTPSTPAWKRLTAAAGEQKTIALTGLPETMAAFVAAKLADETGKRVLLLSGNDLKATHDADDGQQLLGTRCACLPGGEIDLTRGASSHESAWRRLETSRGSRPARSLCCARLWRRPSSAWAAPTALPSRPSACTWATIPSPPGSSAA